MIVKGIDTIEFGLDVSNYFSSFSEYLEIFSSLKQKAHEEGIERELEINNISFKVHRIGIKFYAFRLSCNDFFICFMDKEVKNTPPIKIRFLASYLWSMGFQGAVERFYEWFKHFNLNIESSRISRVDICVDSDEYYFCEDDINKIVTRARGKSKHFVNDEFYNGRKFSGLTIGRGDPILARIYNKTLEIKTSQKTWFHQVWKENSWNDSEEVWRTEFQIRRKALKEFGVNSIEDFLRIEPGIWRYLTTKWLILKNPSSDKNQSRWDICEKWQLIQDANIHQTTSPAVREKVRLGNTPQLLDQVTGLLITIGALNNLTNLNETTELVKRWTEAKLFNRDTTFDKEKEQRIKRFLVFK
ncbi:replication initiation factor [Ectobacillus polymachus]|uniref:replication initiation factor n=1 Tax=Ectobacillus polymachus TaxID=1508806 RepID=UPI003A8AFECC